MKNLYFLLLLLLPALAWSQKIDNTATYRDMKSGSYFRFHYDNDFFTATDLYYTQGYSFEMTLKSLRHNPLNTLFFKAKNSEAIYGLSYEHIGFAPSSISSDSILVGDRPFAAALALKSFLVSTDTIRKYRIASSLGIGIIGPGAFGKEMQVTIHRWIGDEQPKGWQHQIRNDLYLNYEVAHEQELLRVHNWMYLNTNAKLRLGTVNTNVQAGITLALGKVNAPFAPLRMANGFQLYAYYQPAVTLVGYDATLQGGLLNRSSPYVIPDGDIRRVTLQQNLGIVLQLKRLYFEYSRAELTREFQGGTYHKWGGFRIGCDW